MRDKTKMLHAESEGVRGHHQISPSSGHQTTSSSLAQKTPFAIQELLGLTNNSEHEPMNTSPKGRDDIILIPSLKNEAALLASVSVLCSLPGRIFPESLMPAARTSASSRSSVMQTSAPDSLPSSAALFPFVRVIPNAVDLGWAILGAH